MKCFPAALSRWLRWFIKPRRELYLSIFSFSFFSAQSLFVSMALVYSSNTHYFFLVKGEAIRPSGYKCVFVCIVKVDGICDVVFRSLALFWPALGGRISCSPTYSKILSRPHSAWASGLRAQGKCHRGSKASFSSVEDLRIENIISLHIPWCMAIRGSCRAGQ